MGKAGDDCLVSANSYPAVRPAAAGQAVPAGRPSKPPLVWFPEPEDCGQTEAGGRNLNRCV